MLEQDNVQSVCQLSQSLGCGPFRRVGPFPSGPVGLNYSPCYRNYFGEKDYARLTRMTRPQTSALSKFYSAMTPDLGSSQAMKAVPLDFPVVRSRARRKSAISPNSLKTTEMSPSFMPKFRFETLRYFIMEGPISEEVSAENPYSRLVALKKMGIVKNYEVIREKRVAVVGVGGVGSVAAEMLIRLGVGRLMLFDYDRVEMANMNRMFYMPAQVGLSKVAAAAQTLRLINPGAKIETCNQDVTKGSGYQLLRECVQSGPDLVLSCVDNYTARLTVNRLCAEFRQVWLQSGVSEDALSSHVQLIVPGQTACFACAPPLALQLGPQPKRQGVCVASLPTTMNITAGFLVHNALKYLLEFGEVSCCLGYNSRSDFFTQQKMLPNPECTESFCKLAQASPLGVLARLAAVKQTEVKARATFQNQWGIQTVEEGQTATSGSQMFKQQKGKDQRSIADLMAQLKSL